MSFFAQPYEFKVGATPGKERKRDFVDNPNGLFSAQAAPKPPPAMYSITEGMKVGGKVMVSSFFPYSFGFDNFSKSPLSLLSSQLLLYKLLFDLLLLCFLEDCHCSSRGGLWRERNE